MFARVRVSVSTLFADLAGHLVRVGPILALDGSTGQARRDVAQPRAGVACDAHQHPGVVRAEVCPERKEDLM